MCVGCSAFADKCQDLASLIAPVCVGLHRLQPCTESERLYTLLLSYTLGYASFNLYINNLILASLDWEACDGDGNSSDTKTEVWCSDLASKNLPEMKNVSSEALKKTFVAVEASIESSKF